MEKKRKKFRKTFNPNIIRSGISYTYHEAAELLQVHEQTVHSWKKEGLNVVEDKKPYLILGKELKTFIGMRQKKRKIKCKENEFYCLKCRAPRNSIDNIVSIIIYNKIQLNIRGVCCICGSLMYRGSSVQKIPEIHKIFTVESVEDKDLSGYVSPSRITHFRGYDSSLQSKG